MTRRITTIKALQELIEGNQYALYVRWSRGYAMDRKQGVSRDYAAGSSHTGLSAVEIDPSWLLRGDKYLARRLCEYIFLRLKDNRIGCHIYEGIEIGMDSDGYPSITDIEHIATISNVLIDKLFKLARAA